jgi:hypothetical protein
MQRPWKTCTAVLTILFSLPFVAPGAEKDLLPPQLTQEQRDNLLRFLQDHSKPQDFMPADAKVVDTKPPGADSVPEKAPPVRQYTVQIVSHRPVPGQEKVTRVDVYYYRPNPTRGKRGITVRHTVDITTGKQVGATEVFFNRHTPLSQEEVNEALALAREKSPEVQKLYKEFGADFVRYEYLQLMINRKHEPHEPGDRVVRFVFTAFPGERQKAPEPVRVIVNLTQGVAVADTR